MGKAKKGKKKSKKQQVPLPPSVPLPMVKLPHEMLGEELDKAKNNYSDITIQYDFCDMIKEMTRHNPEAFAYGNYRSEIPITIIVALGRHGPHDPMFRQYTSTALIELIATPCLESVFKYGSKAIKECMEEHFGLEKAQEQVIVTIRKHLGDPEDHERHWAGAYDNLGKVGFHDTVIKAMVEHPENEEILFGGGKVLANLLKFCTDGERRDAMLTDTTEKLLYALAFPCHIKPLIPYHFCEVLCIIMQRFPAAIPCIKDDNGPRRVTHNGLLKVIHVMDHFPDDANFQGSACEFLSFFTQYDELQNQCFSAVMEVLKKFSDDASTRKRCMSFMIRMFGAPNGRSLVLQHSPFFLEMMRQYKEWQVQAVGCMILTSYTYRVEANEQITHKEAAHLFASAIKMIATAIETIVAEEFENQRIMWAFGIEALSHLMERGEKEAVTDALLEEDSYDHLAAAMSFYSESCNRKEDLKVCTILHEMASSKRNDIKLKIATSKCAALIIDCMKASPGDEAIQRHGCAALGEVTINKDPQIFEEISKADGANVILDAVDRFPKNKVIFNFGGSAAILTREYEDDKKYGKLDFSRCG